MDRIGAGAPGGVDHRRDVEVTRRRRRRPDADRSVGRAHVTRGRVGVRVDRHRLDPQFVAGTDDPQRDLAAIGYEDPRDIHEGGRFARKAPMPSWPSFETRRSAIASIVYSTAAVPWLVPT